MCWYFKIRYYGKKYLDGVNRQEFVTHLEEIVKIRNEVMHINPDPIDKEDLNTLQKIAKFFQRLRNIRGTDEQQAL
jgi:hypothetical protein